ncbi:MAG: hypothetical protein J7K47_00365 [Thermoplasmata archaeon]|nr:hypothetical protein [Thermoplasmata archaeon]
MPKATSKVATAFINLFKGKNESIIKKIEGISIKNEKYRCAMAIIIGFVVGMIVCTQSY